MKNHLVGGVLIAASLGAHGTAQAGPAGPALDRPALSATQASRGVLLAAARAGERLVAVGERGIVIWSDDGGKQWRQATVPVSVTLTAVQFVDPGHGWAVGHGGVVLASHDGGQSWSRQLDGVRAARLLQQDAQARNAPRAIREAERMIAEGADKPLLALHFYDRARGIVVGAYNMAFATTDGGQSWQPWSGRIDNPQGYHLYAIRAQGDTVLIAGEKGLVYKSTDQGAHFAAVQTPYQGSFFTAEILADGQFLLAGLRGNAWRSSDGGANWAAVSGAAPLSFVASALRGPDEAVLANQAGQLYSFRHGALQSLPGSTLAPPAGLLPLANGGLLALTLRGAIVLPPTTGANQ
ncbi:MAG: YCF48-related protein [Pseudomonadota bacterium]